MSSHRHDLNNRSLIAAIKLLLTDAAVIVTPVSNRVRQHPDYERDYRPTRFVRLITNVCNAVTKRTLSRRINNLVWLRHQSSVWYQCRWHGKILELVLDKNGD
jgi:hypothetical protein